MIVPFLNAFGQQRKLPVGAQEAAGNLARALSLGLHESSLEGFYEVARRGSSTQNNTSMTSTSPSRSTSAA